MDIHIHKHNKLKEIDKFLNSELIEENKRQCISCSKKYYLTNNYKQLYKEIKSGNHETLCLDCAKKLSDKQNIIYDITWLNMVIQSDIGNIIKHAEINEDKPKNIQYNLF